MEPRVVKPPGQDLVVERLKSRYGLVGGCLSEVRPGPARFAGSRICRLERARGGTSGGGVRGAGSRRARASEDRCASPRERAQAYPAKTWVRVGAASVRALGGESEPVSRRKVRPKVPGGSAGAACVRGPGVRVGRREGAPRGARVPGVEGDRGRGTDPPRSPLHPLFQPGRRRQDVAERRRRPPRTPGRAAAGLFPAGRRCR